MEVGDPELQAWNGNQVTTADALLFVTRTVRDLVIGADIEFQPLGLVALRGVPGKWELFTASNR